MKAQAFAMTTMPIEGMKAPQPAEAAETRKVAPPVRSKVDDLSPSEQFEAFTMRSFVESMLPSEASNFFGGGTAGNIWRSMMAEQLGNQLARDGGIGIADMISRDRGLKVDAQSEIKAQTSQSARMRFDALLAETKTP